MVLLTYLLVIIQNLLVGEKMKKLALSVVVAGVFIAECGDNLPKEIT